MTPSKKSRRSPVVVLTTVGDEHSATATARTLVEERLAACVNRVAVGSTYRWKGAVEEDDEQLLIIKTSDDVLVRLEARLAELSSYEVPEFVALQPSAMSEAYLGWLLAACREVD